jgi:hypothetical protein
MDFNKFMKNVKKGFCLYNNFFNGQIKMAEDIPFAEDDWSNEAIEWRLQQKKQQEQEQQQQEQQIGQQTQIPQAVPSNFNISNPPKQLPEKTEVEEAMETWVGQNKREIELEGQNDIGVLVEKIRKHPDESQIPPAPNIYREIHKNRDNEVSLRNALVNKIVQQTNVKDENKASLFVETMIVKTRDLIEDIQRREMALAREERLKKKEQERDLQRKMRDPYAIAVPLEDYGLDRLVEEKFLNLTPEQRVEMEEITGLSYDPNSIAVAAEAKFSAPKSGRHLDQRMSFFLRFPRHILSVMDENFQSILQQELSSIGYSVDDPEDIVSALSAVYNSRKDIKRISNVLTNEKGPELLSILKNLIENAHIDVAMWLKTGMKADKVRSISYHQMQDSERRSVDDTLQGRTPSEAAPIQMNAADMKEATDLFGRVLGLYFSPITRSSYDIQKKAVNEMLTSNIEKYKMAKTEEKKNKIMKKYNLAEQFDAFITPLLDHIDRISSSYGKINKTKEGELVYKTPEGVMPVSKKVLDEIVKREPGEEKVPVSDISGLMKRYSERMKRKGEEGYTPPWSKLVNYRYPVNSYRNLSKLKQRILEIDSQNPEASKSGNFDKIKKLLFANEDFSKFIEDFLNINLSKLTPEDKKKIDDFIFMTLNQSKEHIKWLETLGPKKEESFKNTAKDPYHQLKEDIGTNFPYILGYLAQIKDQKIQENRDEVMKRMAEDPDYVLTEEDKKAFNDPYQYDDEMSIIISLMDHHPHVRNFMRAGRQINHADPNKRMNTQLYYDLQGKEVPPKIQELMDLYRQGVEERSAKKRERGEKIKVKKLENNSWYRDFFSKYDSYDALIRAKEKKERKVQSFEDDINKTYDKANKRVRTVKNSPKEYERVLESIPDEGTKLQFIRDMEAWNGREPLPLDYYTYFGQATTKNVVNRLLNKKQDVLEGYNNKKGKFIPGIKDIDNQMKEINKELNDILKENNYTSKDPSALRLAREAYRRAITKIASLERFKAHNIKIASNINIDLKIAKIKVDFDRYFESLFLKK